MVEQLKSSDSYYLKISAIREVKEKTVLLDRCRRKLEMVALDPEEVKILEAARYRLTEEINRLCWRIGL